jgi:hypothetical protein
MERPLLLGVYPSGASHGQEGGVLVMFHVPLVSGIGIGSTEKEILPAYGAPDHVFTKPHSKLVQWYKRGIAIWLNEGKVVSFTVIKPKDPTSAAGKTEP